MLHETFPAVIDRGGGLLAPERLNYLGELAVQQLEGVDLLDLVGATAPVSSSPTPTCPSDLVPAGCDVVSLAGLDVDVAGALEDLADALGARRRSTARTPPRPWRPPRARSPRQRSRAAVGTVLPAGCVVVDESNTSGVGLFGATTHAGPHSWLTLTGGAIGDGLPAAWVRRSRPRVGASCASSPTARSATRARRCGRWRARGWTSRGLLLERQLRDPQLELMRVGATASGERARAMLDLTGPARPREDRQGLRRPRLDRDECGRLVVQLEKALATEARASSTPGSRAADQRRHASGVIDPSGEATTSWTIVLVSSSVAGVGCQTTGSRSATSSS